MEYYNIEHFTSQWIISTAAEMGYTTLALISWIVSYLYQENSANEEQWTDTEF